MQTPEKRPLLMPSGVYLRKPLNKSQLANLSRMAAGNVKSIQQYEKEAVRQENGCLLHPSGRTAVHSVYRKRHGPVPKGLQICHQCDVGNCIEDTHHWLGTQKQNMQDAVQKKRMKGMLGKKHSTKTKAAISRKKKGVRPSDKAREKMRLGHAARREAGLGTSLKGKPWSLKRKAAQLAKQLSGRRNRPISNQHRAKLSAAHTGKTISAETRAKISASLKGRPGRAGYKHTDETKEKLRRMNLGKIYSEETKIKLSLAGLGRVVTADTKTKMSASMVEAHSIRREFFNLMLGDIT